MSTYTVDIGVLNGWYLARVLRDDILLWQDRRTYEKREDAVKTAEGFIKRVEEPR